LKLRIFKFIIISSIITVSGCGGGGSSPQDTNKTVTTDSTDNNQKLEVYAGDDRKTQINTPITIFGYVVGDKSNIYSYEWTKDKKTLATTLKFIYIPTKLGVDTLTLTVTTNDGEKLSDNTKVEVLEEYYESPLPF